MSGAKHANKKMSRNTKLSICFLAVLGVIVAVFAVLYFTSRDVIYLKTGLLAVGVLNVVNGFVALKNGIKSVAVVFLIGGLALAAIMIYAILR